MSQSVATTELAGTLGAWTHRSGPLYARLADAVQDAAEQSALDAGARLPAERALAETLQVSRGTVVAAYAALADRGVVVRRQGSGTTLTAARGPAPGPSYRSPDLTRSVSGPPVQIDLTFGAPPPDAHVMQLAAAAADALAAGAPRHGYAPLGLPALRQGIADRLAGRGIASEPDEVLVTAGAQGALHLVTTALVRRGDRVLVEAPTYPGAIETFSRAGAVAIGIRRDAIGPRPEDLERLLAVQPPALVFLVPTCHNPTGAIMHEQRRRELLAICRRHEVLVVEDLTLADLAYDGTAPPDLAALDAERVITIGSFSKVLWGGLRVGYVRADRSLILRLGRLKAAQDLGTGMLDQAACVAALPRLDEIIAARRAWAAERYEITARLLAEQLPAWELGRPRGGYSLWCRLPTGGADAFVATALGHGVALSSGSAAAPEDLFLDHVRVTFAHEPDVLADAVGRLRAAWDAHDGGG